MAHQVLVLGEGDLLFGQAGPQDQRHRWCFAGQLFERVVRHIAEHRRPSRTPPGEPGSPTISVRPATPHTPRDSAKERTFGRPEPR